MPDMIVFPLNQGEMPQGCWECDISSHCKYCTEDGEPGRPKTCPLIEISGTRIVELLRGKND